jgi:hypothetical protein
MKYVKFVPLLVLVLLFIIPTSAYTVGRTWNQSNPSSTLSTCIDTSLSPIACPTFNNVAPWSGMGRVSLDGQTMVIVPAFYYRVDNRTTAGFHYMDFWISDIPTATFALHPAFITDSRTLPYFMIGAFEGSAYDVSTSTYMTSDNSSVDFNATTGDKLSSVTGVKPMSGKNNAGATLPAFRQIAKNRGTGWGLQTFGMVSAIELMYLVEYGDFNSQSKLSAGITQITDDAATNMAMNTGFTAGVGGNSSNLGNSSGEITTLHYQTAQSTKPMSYRGVENFYGNLYNWADGLNIKGNNMPWVADHDFASDTFAHPYVDTGLTLPAANGYASNLAYAAGFDWAFLPSAAAGLSNTYLCDYYYQNPGNRAAVFGGAWNSGVFTGAFSWFLADAPALVGRRVGARAAYIPPDTTPPNSITGLTNTSQTCNQITWTYINPTTADFSHTLIYKDNIAQANAGNTTTTLTWTGLNPSQQYTLSTKTADLTGNINSTWTNQTATVNCPETYSWCGRQDVFFWNQSSNLTGFRKLNNVPEKDIQRNITSASITASSGEVTLGTWITDAGAPGTTTLAPGSWDFRTYFTASSSAGNTRANYRIFNQTHNGTKTWLFFGSAITKDITSGTIPGEYQTSYARRNYTTFYSGDRLGIQINVTTDSASARTVTMDMAGNTNASMVSIAYFLCPDTATPTTAPAAVQTWQPEINPSTDIKTDYMALIKTWWWLPALMLAMIYLFGRK